MAKPYTALLGSNFVESPVTAISAGFIEINVNPNYSHNFAGVEYYSDSAGTTKVIPTAGTETYTLKTTVQPNDYQSFQDNTLNASTPDQVDWAANTEVVRVTLAGVSGNGATHAKLIFVGNIT